MAEHLGITITKIRDDALVGTMPVDPRTKQPAGLLHGGASCAFAETLGSMAANNCIDEKEFIAVGLDINANHVRSIDRGQVIGVAKPLHLGRSTQVWEIIITNEADGKLICVSRLTMAIIEKKKKKEKKERQ